MANNDDNYKKIKNKIKKIESVQRCKYTDEQIVSRILELCCEDRNFINDIKVSKTMFNMDTEQAYYKIRSENIDFEYILSNYDIEPSNIEVNKKTIKDIYIDRLTQHESFNFIRIFMEDYKKSIDKDNTITTLINKLEIIRSYKNGIDINNKSYFFNDEIDEFGESTKYLNTDAIPVAIDYYDNEIGNRFNYPGSLGMILGRTGEGKTFEVIKQVVACLNEGKKVLFITAEMSKAEFYIRFIPFLFNGEITRQDILDGNKEKYDELRSGVKRKYRNKLIILGQEEDYDGKLSKENVKSFIETYHPDVVYVDYIQAMEGGDDFRVLTDIVKNFKDNCIDFGINMVFTAQAHEESRIDNGNDQFPMLDHIKGAKDMAIPLDWALSFKTRVFKKIIMMNAYRIIKARHNGVVGICPHKYITIPNHGVHGREKGFDFDKYGLSRKDTTKGKRDEKDNHDSDLN